MIGGNEVNGSVCKTFDDLLAVLCGAKWRIHFGQRSVSQKCLISQSKMMRCCFCVNFSTEGFKSADHFYRDTRADMLDNNICAGAKCQKTITGNQRFLGNGRGTIDAKLFRYSTVIDSIILNKRRIFLMETYRYT